MELENKHTFRCSNLPEICFGRFQEMKRLGDFCDVTIRFGSRTVSAHRMVLAAAMPYFRKSLSSHEMSGDVKEIDMHDVNPSALECLIEFAYTCELEITTDNVETLLSAACALEVEQVRDACVDFLVVRLCPEHALNTWKVAARLNLTDLKENADHYICQNFDDVTHADDFLNAPFIYVNDLIGKDDLQTSSEENVFELVMRWIKKEPEDRGKYLLEMLRKVRIKILSPQYLIRNVVKEHLIKSSTECRDFVDEAIHYYALIEDKHNPTRSGTRSKPLTKNKSSEGVSVPSSMHLITEESSLNVQYFNPENQEWILTKTSAASIETDTVVQVNGKICRINRGRLSLYDPRSSTISFVNVRAMPRFYVSAATLKDKLYLCGGRDADKALNAVERFDIKNQFKRSLVASMTERRNLCGVVALDEYLYCMGGQDEQNVHGTAERYSAVTNRWTRVSPMLTKRCNFGCCTLNQKIYVCGGMESLTGKHYMSAAEGYDPNKDQWIRISQMITPRTQFPLLSSNGKLHAVGGFTGKTFTDTVEVYDPEKGKWCPGPLINMPYEYIQGTSIFIT